VQVCRCAGVQGCKCAGVQVCRQVCKCAGVRVCRCAVVQLCSCAGVQVCKCARVRVCACAGVQVCRGENLCRQIAETTVFVTERHSTFSQLPPVSLTINNDKDVHTRTRAHILLLPLLSLRRELVFQGHHDTPFLCVLLPLTC